MKALAVLSVGGLLWTTAGCMDQTGTASDAVNATEATDATDTGTASDASDTDTASQFDEVVAQIGRAHV